MINVNQINNERIVGNYVKMEDDKQSNVNFAIAYNEKTYNKMLKIQESLEAAGSIKEVKKLLTKFDGLASETAADVLKQMDGAEDVYMDEKSGKCYLQSNGVKSSVAMPTVLVDWIKSQVDKKGDIRPIIKFWARLLRNPNIRSKKQADLFAHLVCGYVTRTRLDNKAYNEYVEELGYSDEKAREMATVPQTPLTKSGLVSTKKVVQPMNGRMKYKYVFDDEAGQAKRVLREEYTTEVNEDTGETKIERVGDLFNEDWVFEPYIMNQRGDEFHCGSAGLGHIIKVGSEMKLDSWDQVNCDHNQSCVPGLHTGNHDYINGFQHDSNVTLNCFVCPSQIGAVSCGEDVLRVKSLFPHSILNREMANKNFYAESSYADLKDLEWAEYLAEAVARFEDKKAKAIAEIDQEVNELNAL